jgi:NAD(P)-dependent dehydrogenase (short-subunit alcohol dehydrogenase family)
VIDLDGKIAVVTGGNSGIGKETAVALANLGATVVIAARNATKAAAAVKEIQERTGAGERVRTMPIDLASFASVHAFATAFTGAYDRCDILCNNAGLVLRKRIETEDGHESTFQINHLSHFLLTNLLREHLARSDSARVVTVASEAHKFARKGLVLDDLDWNRRRYRAFGAYGASKLENILFTRELTKRWEGSGITANAVHPGFVGSNFGRENDLGALGNVYMRIARPFAKSNAQGALTSIYACTSPQLENVTGRYLARSAFATPNKRAGDDTTAAKLWQISAELTGVG